MRPKLLIRIAAGAVLFFALGHTMGHISRFEAKDSQTQEFIRTLLEFHVDLFGQQRTFGEMYTGLSLNLIFTLLALASLLWTISGFALQNTKSAIALLLPIAVLLLSFAITSYIYFFPVPAITSFVAFLLLVLSIVQLGKTNA